MASDIGRLKRFTLPAELIVNYFVHNVELPTYEDYLLEYINSSKYFRKILKTDFAKITHQSNGEADACAGDYYIDFKRWCTSSSLKAKNLLSNQKMMNDDGVEYTFYPKRLEGMYENITHALCRKYSLDEIEEIDSMATKKNNTGTAIDDIKLLLDILKTPKNLLCFSCEICFSEERIVFNETVDNLIDYLTNCYLSFFKFRDKNATGFDLYYSLIFEGYFILCLWDGFKLNIVDVIPLSKSKSFMRIYDLLDLQYKQLIKIK